MNYQRIPLRPRRLLALKFLGFGMILSVAAWVPATFLFREGECPPDCAPDAASIRSPVVTSCSTIGQFAYGQGGEVVFNIASHTAHPGGAMYG